MNRRPLKQILFSVFVLLASFPEVVFAHENYVLTHGQIDAGMRDWSINVFDALKKTDNLRVALSVGILILSGIVLYFYFQKSKAGRWLDRRLKRAENFGHVVLRIALAASLIFSALSFSYLGPEISSASLPLGGIIHVVLFLLGILLLFGVWSEAVGAVSFLILLLATYIYKDYMLTYANYYGEFLALLFFGSRVFSFDRLIHGPSSASKKRKQIEIALIRITYGISILYPAIAIKLLHPGIIIQIVEQYHLTQFHWLFPHDPLLVSLGGGLTQVLLGIFLILGFETRLSTLITFILMTLSVIFFQEAVWPHYILLALAFYLMINNGGEMSLDNKLMENTSTRYENK